MPIAPRSYANLLDHGRSITPPSSHADYNAVLRRSLGSKLFFMDKVPLSEMGVVVDFRCGDASLLRVVANAVPEDCLMIGVDSDKKQLHLARQNFVGLDEAFLHMDYCRFYIESTPRPTMLILSSVVHEVLSPGTTWSPEGFWGWVASFGFDYIVFRDMAYNCSGRRPSTEMAPYWDSPNRRRAQELSFMERWGRHGMGNQELVHYLLKEPYADDWERENAEDYWAFDIEPMHAVLGSSYEDLWSQRTIQAHFRERVLKVHGFELPPGLTTHLELVLRKWTPKSPPS